MNNEDEPRARFLTLSNDPDAAAIRVHRTLVRFLLGYPS